MFRRGRIDPGVGILYRSHWLVLSVNKKPNKNQYAGLVACELLRNHKNKQVAGKSKDDRTQGNRLSDIQYSSANENRLLFDRRAFTWRTVLFGFARSRRQGPRRDGEAEPVFTDWHHPWLAFLAIGIMLMSSLDAFMTLRLIDLGAYEANPIMAAMMERGTGTFAVSKMLLTGIGILALVFLARAMFLRRIRTGLILTAFFSFYAVLICYEFVNLINRL